MIIYCHPRENAYINREYSENPTSINKNLLDVSIITEENELLKDFHRTLVLGDIERRSTVTRSTVNTLRINDQRIRDLPGRKLPTTSPVPIPQHHLELQDEGFCHTQRFLRILRTFLECVFQILTQTFL